MRKGTISRILMFRVIGESTWLTNTCVVSSANAAMTGSIIDRESTSAAAINSDRQTEQNQ